MDVLERASKARTSKKIANQINFLVLLYQPTTDSTAGKNCSNATTPIYTVTNSNPIIPKQTPTNLGMSFDS